jgi:8-oxo-dGTP diphosphatase
MGLRREVHEETGLDIGAETLTGVYKNLPRGIVALIFRCRWVAGRPRLNDEVTDFRWATRDEVTELLDGAYAVRLLDALAYDGKAAVRAHDGVQVLTDIDAVTAAVHAARKRRR